MPLMGRRSVGVRVSGEVRERWFNRVERREEISVSQLSRLGKRSSPLGCLGEDSEK